MQHGMLTAASFITDGLVVTASGHLDRMAYGVPQVDNRVRIWNPFLGQALFVQNLQHDHEVMSVVFGPGYKLAATNSAERSVGGGRGETLVEDSTVRLWNTVIPDRRQIYELVHDRGVGSAAFSPGGNRLLTRAGKAVRLWDVPTGELQFTLGHDDLVASAFFGPHGRSVITASKDKTARIWDVDTGKQQFLTTHDHSVKSAFLIGSGSLLATVADRTLRVWRTASGAASIGAEIFSLDLDRSSGVRPNSFSPDGRLLVLVSGKAVQVWDVEENVKRFDLAHNRRVLTAAFTAGGLLVTRSDENTARAWDMKNGETKFIFGQAGHVRKALISSDGRSVITISRDNTAILRDAQTGGKRFPLEHKEEVRFVRLIAAGRLAVSGSFRDSGNICEIKVWEVETGKERAVFVFSPHTSFQWEHVRFSPNGKLMLTLSSNSAHRHEETLVRVWDLETAEERFDKPFRSDKRLKIIDFSPDSKRLLTKAVNAKKVELWAISGDLLQAAVAAATTVCLAPEFRRLNLGESDAEAYKNWKACERRHGRE
jgi:WD40 repeat protein